MIDQQSLFQLARLQERVFRCIEDELNMDGTHKSYEGAIDVTYSLPNIFEREQSPVWSISLHCYVMAHLDGRHRSVTAPSLPEAIAKAEQLIGGACERYEFQRFSRRMDAMCDEEAEIQGATVYGGNKHSEAGNHD